MNIEYINKEFTDYLELVHTEMVSLLTSLIEKTDFDFLESYTFQDAKAYCFEYEFDYLSLVLWIANKNFEPIAKTILFPNPKQSKKSIDSDWNAFFPEKIWTDVAIYSDKLGEEDEDEQIDFMEEYSANKRDIFETWFCQCWQEAIQEVIQKSNTAFTLDAYFSIHDTSYKIDLSNKQEIKEQQILERYKKQ